MNAYKYGECGKCVDKKTDLKIKSRKIKLGSCGKGAIFSSYQQGQNVQAASGSALSRGLLIVEASF